MKEAAIDSSNALLIQTVNNIDMQMENFWNYPDAIHRNNQLNRPVFRADHGYNTYHIMQEMEKMFGYNSFVEKVIFYNKESSYFYSFPGSYPLDEFNEIDSTFYYPNWDKRMMLQDLNQLTDISIRSAEPLELYGRFNSSYDAVTVLMPVPYRNLYSYGVLMLVIPEHKFFLNQPYDDDEIQHNFFVFDKEGELLAASDHESEYEYHELVALLEDRGENLDELITLSGKRYLISLQASKIYGLTFMSVTPLEDVLHKITRLKAVTFLLIMIIISVEVLLIYLFMRTNYEPIRKLRKKALVSVKSLPTQNLNEYEVVSYAFDSLHNENRELFSKVMLNKNISKEYFFIQYLNGTLPKDDVSKQAIEHQIQLKEYVCSLTFFAKDRNIITLLPGLKGYIDLIGTEFDQLGSYLVKGLRHEDFILILTMDQQELAKLVEEKLRTFSSNVRIGVGTVEKVERLNNSYIHSLAALEVSILNEQSQVVDYDQIDVESANVLSQLFDTIKVIEMSLTRRDSMLSQKQLNKLINLMKTKVSSIFVLKMIFINTYNVLAKELNQLGHNEDYYYAISEKKIDVLQLEKILRSMSEKLVTEWESHESVKGSVNIQEVLNYLDQHYMDANMSMQQVADQFGLSYTNFSHYFKKKIGENFAPYLEKRRINEAKILLSESKYPIKFIAEQVGYLNANSFTRSFKKVEGISPGEYRKLN